MAVISIVADIRMSLKGEIQTDSNAAMGIVYRQGLGGKARHIKVRYLWIQDSLKDGDFHLKKVGTHVNIADMLTKHVSAEDIRVHMHHPCQGYCGGRHNIMEPGSDTRAQGPAPDHVA